MVMKYWWSDLKTIIWRSYMSQSNITMLVDDSRRLNRSGSYITTGIDEKLDLEILTKQSEWSKQAKYKVNETDVCRVALTFHEPDSEESKVNLEKAKCIMGLRHKMHIRKKNIQLSDETRSKLLDNHLHFQRNNKIKINFDAFCQLMIVDYFSLWNIYDCEELIKVFDLECKNRKIG